MRMGEWEEASLSRPNRNAWCDPWLLEADIVSDIVLRPVRERTSSSLLMKKNKLGIRVLLC